MKNRKTSQIQLKLTAPWQRAMIYKALLGANGSRTKVSVQAEYPASLLALRKDIKSNGDKFRIIRAGRNADSAIQKQAG